VLPEFQVKPFDALSIERPTASVTEDDIDAMIESMRASVPCSPRSSVLRRTLIA